MSEWKEYKLSDILTTVKKQYLPIKGDNLAYIGLEHIQQESLRLEGIGNSDNVTSQKFMFTYGDVLFGKLRPYFRKVVSVNFEGVCSTDIWVFRAKIGHSQKFIKYLVASTEFIETCNIGESGTRMPRADWNYLKDTVWLLPDYTEQERIAEVLSSLDDKIDLLHRNNKTLEQLAETLFRQWFVEDTSASEITIGEITKITSGKSLNRSHFLEKGTYPIYGSNGIIGWTDNYTFDENLIITGRVGTLGTVKIIDEKCWISDNVLIIKPNSELYKYPIYFSMKGYDFESLNVGSTQPLLTQGELNKQLVVILDEYKLLSCKMYFDELFNKIKLNLTQIKQLETLRDTLLPKLMSGVVRVEN